MAASRTASIPLLLRCQQRRSFSAFPSPEIPLQRFIRTSIENRDYLRIPHLLLSHSSANPNPNPNPFSFLSLLPPLLTARIVDELLQSFVPLRPRSLPYPAYASLLSLTLSNPNPTSPSSVLLPLALAVLQATIRSGLPPPPSTRLSLSLSWLHLRRGGRSVPTIFSSMPPLGYRPDLNTCNFIISSLCAASEPSEAIAVLRGMSAAGLDPDSESFSTVIEATGGAAEAEEMLREMVEELGMRPRKGTVVRLVAGMRAEGEVRRAAVLVRFLEKEGCRVGFEAYEAVVEGCLEKGELVLAARVVAEMAGRGFIPYIGMRRRVVEGLAGIGQCELASAVRQRLAEIGS